MLKAKIFSDGSSRGNPGPGGYGTILKINGDVDEKTDILESVIKSFCDSPENETDGDFIITNLEDNDFEFSERAFKGYKKTTNNRMELMGVIKGFEMLQKVISNYGIVIPTVEVVSDSKYVSDPFNKGWIKSWVAAGWMNSGGNVKNKDLWKKLIKLMEPYVVNFTWVKGHASHPENNQCDMLAVNAALSKNLIEDTGYMEGSEPDDD